ncbi:MAG TPA: diguanylate cyclase [Thermoanaerobaculia bacterium]|nr:diguanylate cyclase [Thermoanaerobaculia bacterium]
MNLSLVGLAVQTVGTALLATILLYLSRGKGSRVLQAAGVAWIFLFVALASLLLLTIAGFGYRLEVYQYWKFLYMVALCVATIRMDRDLSLTKPLVVAAVAGIPISLLIGHVAANENAFYAIHMGILGMAWLLAAVFIFQSPRAGLGRQCAGAIALVTAVVELVYVLLFAVASGRTPAGTGFQPLPYIGFLDVLLEMLFGIGLIIWAMEDTERRLAALHARTADDSRRSQRRAWLDPLTETHNRFFLDEVRPELEADEAGGSIVLIDIDGLKRINDQEGHEEGDKAIWTVATGIKKLVRGNDHVIRWGGDEFLVILPGMDEELARRRFYMLPAKIDEVKQSPKPGGKPYLRFLAASVGIHPYSKRLTLDLAIAQADRVMYERKRAHRELHTPRGPAKERTP